MRMLPILLVCPFMTGCFAFGLPNAMQIPPIAINEPDVWAFCVTRETQMSGPWMTGPIAYRTSAAELRVEAGKIAPRRDTYFKYTYLAIPFAEGSYERYIEVRIYRRGFETVIIPARPIFGDSKELTIRWIPADTLEAREKAIDQLTADFTRVPDGPLQALVADEYRLLVGMQAKEADRKRLEVKEKIAREGKSIR